MNAQETSGWQSDRGYIWSLVGSAVGFANLLGFGSQCYKYGGGAFLIPFTVALIVLGIPMLMLEGVIGQLTQAPLLSAYGKFGGSKAKFWGWLSVLAVATIGAFYVVLTGWAVSYVFFAGAGWIPEDTAHFFSQQVLGATHDVSEWGAVSIPVLLGTLSVIAFTWYVLAKNVQDGIEAWCTYFLPPLAALVGLFTLVVCFLPGAWTGFAHYLQPDMSKIAHFEVWRDVFGQLFFSLSLGIGIVVGYSRHTGEKTNIRSAMIQVAMADYIISFLAGFLTLGCLGYMAESTGVPFNEIVQDASTFEIGYVIFPQILATFGPILSRIIGAVFFICVFIAGVTGVFSIVESIVGNVEFEFRRTRRQAVALTMIAIGVMASTFCWGNGTALIGALEPVVLGDNMLIGGIAQTIAFLWLAGAVHRLRPWKELQILRWVAIPILGIILLASFQDAWQQQDHVAADWIRWGWFSVAVLTAGLLTILGERKEQRL